MKFGRVSVGDALGCILAHGVSAEGVSFRKGRVLSPDDIEALRRANVAAVMAARLDADDIAEDETARRIGMAVAGAHTDLSTAMTGRTNLYAAERGIVLVDVARVNALNAIHESITIATLAPFEVVERRQMLATVKIIPFAAPLNAVDRAVQIASPSPSLSWSAKADHDRVGCGLRCATPGEADCVNLDDFAGDEDVVAR
jgi:molybdenum cofactor cytidylyltransferase